MNIDEDTIYNKEDDGYVWIDENKALACLLAADICFLNVVKDKWSDNYTTVVYVIANDIFVWGSADAECISNSDHEEKSEIYALYKLWKENNNWGPIKWLCLKRNEQPQNPIKEDMIKDGYWDAALESLPPNYYWTKIKEENDKKLAKFRGLPPEQKLEIERAAEGELVGAVEDNPLFLRGMNEGCGYNLKPEDKMSDSWGVKFAKQLVWLDKNNE